MMRTPHFWRTRGLASTLLLPLAGVYALGARIDRALTPPHRAPLPVLAVGNATAGGAGKTPTAIALAALLAGLGHRPHLITRGYGSGGRGTRRVDPEGDWRRYGDEALLLALAAPSWVGSDRLASAAAAQQAGAGLVIADDALQHHRLAKDTSLLVVDGPFGFGNGRLLPAGPLREPPGIVLARADAVILIGENAQGLAFDLPVFEADLHPLGDTSWVSQQPLLAFAGLARPGKFYDTLRQLGATLAGTQDFPDHHPFTEAELEALCASAARMGAVPVATAKDAVKFPPHLRDRIRVLDVALQFRNPDAVEKWLQTRFPAPISNA